MLGPLARDVSFADLRHDDKPVHKAEGYGGQPIDAFPPCRFFRLREAGSADQARDQYHAWYREQFDRYRFMEKAVGGMKNGSLYRLVAKLHEGEGEPLSAERPTFRDDLIDRAIELRVRQRFELLDSIKQQGYQSAGPDRVIGISRGGRVYLSGGHHRAAALLAINEGVMPGVLVLSPATRTLLRQVGLA
jgi:hypothetical protein